MNALAAANSGNVASSCRALRRRRGLASMMTPASYGGVSARSCHLRGRRRFTSTSKSSNEWVVPRHGALAVAVTTTTLASVLMLDGENSAIVPTMNHAVIYNGGSEPQQQLPLSEGDRRQRHALTRNNVTELRPYEISTRALQGGRLTMEDEFFVADGGRFAAVFDGHGGGGVSSFLRRHLYRLVQKALEEEQKGNTLADHVQALRTAFGQAEQSVMENEELKYQGSTAVAVMLYGNKDGHRIVLSANVGDSRAILSRDGYAVDLTRDHKPNEEREKARILSMGETIEWDKYAKVHRVRNLSLSRAIGDRYAKPVVSSEVEIQHFPINKDDDEFVLLASDGLWDAMTSQEVVSFVHRRMAKEMYRQRSLDGEEKRMYKMVLRRNMAKFVAREALRRGSADNICVVMVWLDDEDNTQTSA